MFEYNIKRKIPKYFTAHIYTPSETRRLFLKIRGYLLGYASFTIIKSFDDYIYSW